MSDLGSTAIAETIATFRKYQELSERAAEQVDDAAFFTPLAGDENSIALVMKHVGGNLRSRFTDFLTTDGEKPDRDRDGEFERGAETRADVLAAWNQGWNVLYQALGALGPDDLLRTITIRGERQTVIGALLRSVTHASHHSGQIVMLAKHYAGDAWKTLSIPKKAASGA